MKDVKTEIHSLLERRAKIAAGLPGNETEWLMDAVAFLLLLELVKREPSPNDRRTPNPSPSTAVKPVL